MSATSEHYAVFLDTRKFPENEHEDIGNLNMLLLDLRSRIADFAAALELFDYCERHRVAAREQILADKKADRENRKQGKPSHFGEFPSAADERRFMQWKFIACRDGAMTIFHVGKDIEAIRASFRLIPKLRGLVNHSKIRLAANLFTKNYFRHSSSVRHAVAHSAELTATPSSTEHNAVRGLTFKSCMGNDGEFMNSFGGKIVSYKLDTATLKALNRIALFDAFDAAAIPMPRRVEGEWQFPAG